MLSFLWGKWHLLEQKVGNLLRVSGETRWNKFWQLFYPKLFLPDNWLFTFLNLKRLLQLNPILTFLYYLRCLSSCSLMNESSRVEKYFTFWFCDKPASDNIGFLVSIFPRRQPCYHSASFNIRLLDFVIRDLKPDRNTPHPQGHKYSPNARPCQWNGVLSGRPQRSPPLIWVIPIGYRWTSISMQLFCHGL